MLTEQLQKWAAIENNTVFTYFANQLVQKIKGVIMCTPDSKKRCGSHSVILSEFKKIWDNVTEASESPKSSLFYFYVTLCIFQEHLKNNYCSDHDLLATPELTLDEENALWRLYHKSIGETPV